jgi:hypothetical protein
MGSLRGVLGRLWGRRIAPGPALADVGAPLTDTVAAVCRRVPEPLLDGPDGLRLEEVARTLPSVLARRPIGLELRLGQDSGADLIVAARPREPDGRALQAWARRTGITRLALALERWQSGFGWLAWNAAYMLLEFDASRDPRAVPCIHLAARGARSDEFGAIVDNAFHADPEGLVKTLAWLAGTPADPTAVEALERMLAALPPFAEMFAAGAMLSRATVPCPRVAVRRLGPDGVGTILTTLGQRWAADALVPLAAELGRLDARFMLDVDVGAPEQGHAGLEIHVGRYWTEGSAEGWAPLLEALVALGLAERERAEAAITLPGCEGPDGPVFGISHVKVGAGAAGLRPAKLYLGVDRAHAAIRTPPVETPV